MTPRDGHIRILPIHVANKIAAGEVVERPASVVKELIENAIDAGAKKIVTSIVQGGRKLVAVQDDGCGMTKDDAVLSLERQATSKIRDVGDIEEIDTMGFRGEAIPSIASVSRFTITTRRADSDEGVSVQVNAGQLIEVRAAGCPQGTLIEVRDLFCNVPARRKFLKSYTTEENHVKALFTVHALAHPNIAFVLNIDGREIYNLAASAKAEDRIRDLFGDEFLERMAPIAKPETMPAVSGYIEKPNLMTPTRGEQYIFINGRPASAPSIAYAIKEAYPRRAGDSRPAAILFIELSPKDVDVNVHPTKREVRFRDNQAVKAAIGAAIERALSGVTAVQPAPTPAPIAQPIVTPQAAPVAAPKAAPSVIAPVAAPPPTPVELPTPAPVQVEFAVKPDSNESKPWKWFRFLAQSGSGYLLIETDAGLVTINPHAARERIAYEKLSRAQAVISQELLLPETVHLSPVDFARITQTMDIITSMGFRLEEFGTDTFKIEAIPQIIGGISPAQILTTIARDLAEGGAKRGERWREELIAKSIAKSFAGAKLVLDATSATKLVEELCACSMPYVCPRGKPVMIFTSTRELDRKFAVNR